MKRELKFRAWYTPDFETVEGAMKFVQIENDDGLWFMWEKDHDFRYEFQFPFIDDDWIIEQYTGINDMNGIEIYEGDLIKTNTRSLMIVTWADGSFKYNYYNGWILIAIDNSIQWNLKAENKYYEIVGNIYENPELLK